MVSISPPRHRRHFSSLVRLLNLRPQPLAHRPAVGQHDVGQELALQRGDARLHRLQLGPYDQQQRPSALTANLLPGRPLCTRRPPDVARRAGVVVDRRHHQHDLHPPAGHGERHPANGRPQWRRRSPSLRVWPAAPRCPSWSWRWEPGFAPRRASAHLLLRLRPAVVGSAQAASFNCCGVNISTYAAPASRLTTTTAT